MKEDECSKCGKFFIACKCGNIIYNDEKKEYYTKEDKPLRK